MAARKRPLNEISKMRCIYCSNDQLVLLVDFKKKWQANNNIAFCIRSVTKNIFGFPTIKGCGKSFKLEVLARKLKLLPPL